MVLCVRLNCYTSHSCRDFWHSETQLQLFDPVAELLEPITVVLHMSSNISKKQLQIFDPVAELLEPITVVL
ncbi:hypothetical protein DPMN_044937 [Dreissena polymorpha]|uniref:Uncharacterized protein n=1 Tax=Dreissena polymorpha TaxID=45954 RepID=A0A9D4D5F5_DREPO|nr:hypothetical protein DPMN_044937 [Dreissena polymorpha]